MKPWQEQSKQLTPNSYFSAGIDASWFIMAYTQAYNIYVYVDMSQGSYV